MRISDWSSDVCSSDLSQRSARDANSRDAGIAVDHPRVGRWLHLLANGIARLLAGRPRLVIEPGYTLRTVDDERMRSGTALFHGSPINDIARWRIEPVAIVGRDRKHDE